MKTELNHLPPHKQAELKAITDIIRETVPAEMMILFGSYARGNWVEVKWDDQYWKYQSDFDILLIVETRSEIQQTRFEVDLSRAFEKSDAIQTPVSVIVHDIEFVNRRLAKAQYFFSDIKKEGILLYDSQKFQLIAPKELSSEERKKLAEQDFEYYTQKIDRLKAGFDLYFSKEFRNEAAFTLHQITENLYSVILLVFSHYKPNTHDLGVLRRYVESVDPRFLPTMVFEDLGDAEDRRLFKLLRKAYVDARYNPNYAITKAELEKIADRVQHLKTLAETLCQEKIKSFH